MSTLGWIVVGGLLMAVVALVGSVTLLLKPRTLDRILLPLVALAGGSLIGGALFHMIPAALGKLDGDAVWLLVLAGFSVFFALEQFLHRHHGHRAGADCRKPMTYLILLGDGLHNFIGGLAIAGTFVIDVRLGVTAWIAAAAHEIPQELGDFGVLVHGGWSKGKALLFNVISALAFLAGGLIAYAASFRFDVTLLIPFAAGNFLYIGATDLVPEVNRHERAGVNVTCWLMFVFGGLLMYSARLLG